MSITTLGATPCVKVKSARLPTLIAAIKSFPISSNQIDRFLYSIKSS
jgi:hypothetical protein